MSVWSILGFCSEAAAQASAFFARKNGGEVEKLKLVKLMYLAERESVRLRGRLMFYDEHYSLKHGPICSGVLNGINGDADRPLWDKYISRNRHRVSPRDENMDQLSRSDMKILEQVWTTHGWRSTSQIRNWTHENCPEYTEVNSGSIRISITEMAKAVGVESPKLVAEELADVRSRAAALS
jgi:uncharacterized phage-associated protein